ncbi:MAG: fibronectin type III domain-containing protein [Bacteriovoracia bacterium]
MKTMLLNYLTLFTMITLLSACNGVGTAKFDEAAIGTGGQAGDGTDSTISFSGISSITGKTDSTLTLNWAAHVDAVAYDVYNVTSGSPVYLTTIFGQASSSTELTSLTPNQLYKFRVRALDSEGNRDSNTNDVSVTTNLAPDIPSGLTRISPVSSPGFSLPTIRVSGVKNGDTIKIFSDNTCTTQVASGTASGSSIDLTPSTLASGTTDFYATATNSFATASGCSTATASYEKLTCPTANGDYIAVTANPTVGTTSEFCVAKFEMKNVSGVATSQASGSPWVSISQTSAKSTCTAIGTGYDLISNEEWMTIAREIETTDTNWSSGTVGTGSLNRGHSDNSPASALAVSNTSDPYDGTGNNSGQAVGSGWEQKRTHTIENGVIWDFAGNVWEWADWYVTPANKAYYSTDGAPQAAWREWTVINTLINNGDEMETITWQATDPALNSSKGIGQYYAGNNTSGGAAVRGGGWGYGARAGAFALHLNLAPSYTHTGIGFRCVFRP